MTNERYVRVTVRLSGERDRPRSSLRRATPRRARKGHVFDSPIVGQRVHSGKGYVRAVAIFAVSIGASGARRGARVESSFVVCYGTQNVYSNVRGTYIQPADGIPLFQARAKSGQRVGRDSRMKPRRRLRKTPLIDR